MADAPASEAKAWMVKAWRDLETARRAATGEPPFYDIAVYHCQQAAEKAVKAFLVHHGTPYEKTHDINNFLATPPASSFFYAAIALFHAPRLH